MERYIILPDLNSIGYLNVQIPILKHVKEYPTGCPPLNQLCYIMFNFFMPFCLWCLKALKSEHHYVFVYVYQITDLMPYLLVHLLVHFHGILRTVSFLVYASYLLV